MSSLRLMSTLRSSLLTIRCCRILLPFSQMSFRYVPSIDLYSSMSTRTQQICLFSSSTVFHARRRDETNATVTENFDDEEQEEKEEDNDDTETDQVIQSSLFF